MKAFFSIFLASIPVKVVCGSFEALGPPYLLDIDQFVKGLIFGCYLVYF